MKPKRKTNVALRIRNLRRELAELKARQELYHQHHSQINAMIQAEFRNHQAETRDHLAQLLDVLERETALLKSIDAHGLAQIEILAWIRDGLRTEPKPPMAPSLREQIEKARPDLASPRTAAFSRPARTRRDGQPPTPARQARTRSAESPESEQ